MSIEAMKQALEALEHANAGDPRWKGSIKMAKENLRQAIEQAVKEKADFEDFVAKVQAVEKEACEIINREWVGLSRGEKLGIIDRHTMRSYDDQQDMLFAIMADANDLLKNKNAPGWQSVSNPTEYLDELRGGDAT